MITKTVLIVVLEQINAIDKPSATIQSNTIESTRIESYRIESYRQSHRSVDKLIEYDYILTMIISKEKSSYAGLLVRIFQRNRLKVRSYIFW